MLHEVGQLDFTNDYDEIIFSTVKHIEMFLVYFSVSTIVASCLTQLGLLPRSIWKW